MTDYTDLSLSQQHRFNVLEDIARWKAEEHTAQSDVDDPSAALEEFITRLSKKSDAELLTMWNTTVGEWIATRDDCTPPAWVSFDTYLDTQLARCVDGRQTDYGFITDISVKSIVTDQ